MKTLIIEHLKNLETELSIQILYAVESGSRAWGFHSQDSDWDVRFIYVHNKNWYLSIDSYPDSYTKILDNGLDLSGWEIRKTLKLFRSCNPPLFEWLSSPIVYLETKFITELRDLQNKFFKPKSCMYHYLRMCVRNLQEYFRTQDVKLKKYFYVLRPILACKWIKEYQTIPPVEFYKLVELVTDSRLKDEINLLLQKKISMTENDVCPRIEYIDQYIQTEVERYTSYLKNNIPPNVDGTTEDLNTLFRKIISI